jgi:hypothetical protein
VGPWVERYPSHLLPYCIEGVYMNVIEDLDNVISIISNSEMSDEDKAFCISIIQDTKSDLIIDYMYEDVI